MVFRRLDFMLLALAVVAPAAAQSSGGQHVGDTATKKRDAALAANPDIVRHKFSLEKGKFDHLPIMKFHPAGEMDLASVSVIGTTRDSNPFQTEVLWVEDEKGKVVFLQENAAFGGFAVAKHLKLPGVTLTPHNLDEAGLWVGEPVVPPKTPQKEEL